MSRIQDFKKNKNFLMEAGHCPSKRWQIKTSYAGQLWGGFVTGKSEGILRV
jgi:hypothetical protein